MCAAPWAAAGQPTPDAEVVFWQSIANSADPADFEDYLERFPNGTFAGLARRRVARLVDVTRLSFPRVRQLAELGDARAQAELGDRYQLGRGGAGLDHSEAVRWYRRSAPVDGQTVGPLHVDDACGEPAAVHRRQPAARVVVPLLIAVHGWRRERQVPQIVGEPPPRRPVGPAEAAVVGLGPGHDVLDVGLPLRPEPAPGIRSVNAAEAADDAVFDRLLYP